jgi:hypothetical protein
MQIPPKQTGRKTVYKFADLLTKKKKFYKADAKRIGNIKSCASTWAKKNGVVVTTRLCSGGVTVYLVEEDVSPDNCIGCGSTLGRLCDRCETNLAALGEAMVKNGLEITDISLGG